MASSGTNIMVNLKQKMQSLRDEADKYKDLYEDKCKDFEKEVTKRSELENELLSFQRRMHLLEEERDQFESKYHTILERFGDASKVVDEHERLRRSMEAKQSNDDEKIMELEGLLRVARASSEVAERKFEEALRKLQLTDMEMDKLEIRAELAENRARQLDTTMNLLTGNLKSLEISEHSLAEKEHNYETSISELNKRLRESEHMVELMARELKCKQNELDRSEDNLHNIHHEHKLLKDEMEMCFRDLNSL